MANWARPEWDRLGQSVSTDQASGTHASTTVACLYRGFRAHSLQTSSFLPCACTAHVSVCMRVRRGFKLDCCCDTCRPAWTIVACAGAGFVRFLLLLPTTPTFALQVTDAAGNPSGLAFVLAAQVATLVATPAAHPLCHARWTQRPMASRCPRVGRQRGQWACRRTCCRWPQGRLTAAGAPWRAWAGRGPSRASLPTSLSSPGTGLATPPGSCPLQGRQVEVTR